MQAASDPALRALLDHHQREEVEHFSMLLEWLRRRDADFDAMLRRYLFTDHDLLAIEDAAAAEPALATRPSPGAAAEGGSLRTTIGSLASARKQ